MSSTSSAVRRRLFFLCLALVVSLVIVGCGGGHHDRISPRDDGNVAVAAQNVPLATDGGGATALTLDTPDVLQAPGTDFQFTVSASDLAGVAGAMVHLQFDATVFSVLDIVAGPGWGAQALTASNPAGVAGESSFAAADTTALPAGAGVIVTFHMQVLAGATPQNATIRVTGVLADVNGATLGRRTVGTRAAAVRPTAALIGDLMRTGRPEVGSAIKILRVVRSLDAPPANITQWDTNFSTAIDAGDASRILACLVGLAAWPIENRAVTFEERKAAIDAVEAKAKTLTGDDPAADDQALANFMAADTAHFEAAGVVPGSGGCWARYRDGRLLVVCNATYAVDGLPSPGTGEPGETTGGGEGTESVAARPVAPASVSPRQVDPTSGPAMPASTKAMAFTGMQPGSPEYAWTAVRSVQSMLSKCDYDVNGTANQVHWATVDALAQVRDVGVFYLDTHGSAGMTRDGEVCAVATSSTPIDAANDTKYATELANGELVDTVVTSDEAFVRRTYGITPAFVRAKMSFAPGSLAVVSACWLAASDMRNAFIAKGARAYCGWTTPVNSDVASRADVFLFDRLLGGAWTHGNPPFRPDPKHPIAQIPAQRSFPLNEIAQDIHARGWDVSPSSEPGVPAAELKVYPAFCTLMLRPVILNAFVSGSATDPTVPAHNTLFLRGLYGYYGNQTIVVKINGTAVPATMINSSELKVDPLPSTGATSSGWLSVSIGGRAAFARSLTSWNVPFTYTDVLGGFTRRFAGTMHLRAFLRGGRNVMGGPLVYHYENNGRVSLGDCATTANWSYSGSETYPNGTTATGSGSGSIHAEDFTIADPSYHYRCGLISQYRLGINFTASTLGARLTTQAPGQPAVEGDGPRLEMKDTDFTPTVTNVEDPAGNFRLAFDLDGDYKIQAGTWTRKVGLRTYTFTWQAAVANDPNPDVMDFQPRSISRLLDFLPWHHG